MRFLKKLTDTECGDHVIQIKLSTIPFRFLIVHDIFSLRVNKQEMH